MNEQPTHKKTLRNCIIIIIVFFLGMLTMYGTFYYFPSTIGTVVTKLEKDVTVTDKGIADAVDKVYDSVVVVNTYVNGEQYASGTGFVYKTENNKAYISLNCKNVLVQEFEKTNKNIGIDLGICNFVILSNGIKISNKKFYDNQEENLDRLQRQLSRKQIGSNRWRKAKIKVGKLQTHIANKRKDFLQKLTTNIVKQFDTICIEDLEVSKMKETDKNKRNKRISDLGFYEFRRQLQYKCEWYGKKLYVIDRYYPSTKI